MRTSAPRPRISTRRALDESRCRRPVIGSLRSRRASNFSHKKAQDSQGVVLTCESCAFLWLFVFIPLGACLRLRDLNPPKRQTQHAFTTAFFVEFPCPGP